MGGGGQGIAGQGTFLNNNIHGAADGIAVNGDNTVIQNNYIHDMQGTSGSHFDAIQADGGFSNLLISHNTIINQQIQTSAIMLDNYWGPIDSVKIDNNLLIGGGYTTYINEMASGQPGGGTVTNVSYTNNHVGGGYFGDLNLRMELGDNVVMSGNVSDGKALLATLNTPANTGGGTTTPPPTTTPPTQPTPNAPVITSGDHVTNDNTVTLTGTAAAGSTVTVLDGVTKLGTVTVDSKGAWSYTTAALADGKHSLTATDTVSGKTSASSSAATLTIDTKAPAAPVVTSDSIVNTNQVVASGTAEAGSRIAVYDGSVVVGTATTNSSGSWSVTTSALSGGAHGLQATATDAAGNVSAASQPFDPLIPVIGGGSTPPPTASPTPTPGKIIESAGATSLVESGGKYYLNGSSGSGPSLKYHGADFVDGTDGTWAPIAAEKTTTGYQVVWKEASTGLYTAWNTDNSGNYVSHVSSLTGSTSGGSVSGTNSGLKLLETNFHQDLNGDHIIGVPGATATPTTPTAPAVTDAPTPAPKPSAEFTKVFQNWNDTVTFNGTADPDSQIKIYDNGDAKPIGSVKVGSDGNWSYKTSSVVSDGIHNFTATVTDKVGNTGSVPGSAVLGTNGNDVLNSTSGNDLFMGNGGRDTFVFKPNFGADVISDFTAAGRGHDVVQFSKSVFDNFADVLSHAEQSGHDVTIDAGGGNTLTLKDTKLAALDKTDFHFV
jgi:hypothetical protein